MMPNKRAMTHVPDDNPSETLDPMSVKLGTLTPGIVKFGI
jgi:hypothetical protein